MSSFRWLAEERAKRGKLSQPSILNSSSGSSDISVAARLIDSNRGVQHRLLASFESALVRNATLLASGAIAGGLEFITHVAIGRMNMPAVYDAFVDASLVALMTIALVGVCISSAGARQRAMLKQIRIASDLNHHLRNALQVITQSRYLPEEKQADAVFASIDRIEETLKRLDQQ